MKIMSIFRILPFFPALIFFWNCSGNPEKHLQNLRMLTQNGQNAEAYFSFNESQLIFQSQTGDMKCDQIYTMDLKGENRKMISSGAGATTCSYFMPGDKKILYASTHLAGKNCPPPPDRSKGYVWKLYDSYDIFLGDADGKNLKRLTNTPGYDAEATVSPTGDKIVFTSLRNGDPEIYVMDLDGKNQKRLTNRPGYDGGAFFSWDGKKIIFRASRPRSPAEIKAYKELLSDGLVRPTAFELYIMDADGGNMKQITNFGKASFGPFFHPDNKRVIFASNMGKNPRNFDLYMINIDGTGLERITYNKTFDGFPMFSRDGKKLVFASNRRNKKPRDTNVFIADWVE